jgi:uncharacterized protein YbjT (DUF2867 family)
MTPPILVTGGTGTLGRQVVERLCAAGHDVAVLSRRQRPTRDGVRPVTGDLMTGAGLSTALDGVTTIVHCAGNARDDAAMTRNLVRAVPRGTRPHLVLVSVAGADRVPQAGRIDRTAFGYYGAKLATERIVADSGLPWTTLRATQFHDLILTVARAVTKLPVAPVPSGRFQPVEADEVAARLVELALGEPAGLVPELGGPRVYTTSELVRGYLRASGRRRPVVSVRLPGLAARAVRDGALLAPDGTVGKRTWEEFLAERVG